MSYVGAILYSRSPHVGRAFSTTEIKRYYGNMTTKDFFKLKKIALKRVTNDRAAEITVNNEGEATENRVHLINFFDH
jgi:hypothetical protein